MACADVATAKAKATAINLIILSSYVNLQEERFLKHADLVTRVSPLAKGSGRKTSATTNSFYEPRPTKRKWVDVPTFSGRILYDNVLCAGVRGEGLELWPCAPGPAGVHKYSLLQFRDPGARAGTDC
jgi:hypothetical protein